MESNNVPQVDVGTIEVNCIRREETDAMIFKIFFSICNKTESYSVLF